MFSSGCSGTLALFLVVLILVYFMMNHVVEGYKKEDPMLFELRDTIRPLHPDTIDRLIFLEDTKSYTINKSKIYLCLRDENGEYYDKNMLVYVTLHELAHVLCDEVGHTDKFRLIFKNILEQGVQMGIYNPNIEPIDNYCQYN